MKYFIIAITAFTMFACNNSGSDKPASKQAIETKKDSLFHLDTFYMDQNEVNSNKYKEYKIGP